MLLYFGCFLFWVWLVFSFSFVVYAFFPCFVQITNKVVKLVCHSLQKLLPIWESSDGHGHTVSLKRTLQLILPTFIRMVRSEVNDPVNVLHMLAICNRQPCA